jgi:threonine dehydrogenase-like Zn-dependent dehydrogenase
VLLLGAAGVSEVDLTQVWFKEAALVGAWGHCVDGTGHSIDRALEVLAAGALPFTTVLTHQFPLVDLREAVTTALDRKGTGAIKVTLRPCP